MTALLALPPVWLIVLLAGLGQLSETVYTPALPDIARALETNEAMVEYTLTVYLMGFALGVLFWGKLSDRWGRKPCVLGGLGVFIIGCVMCYVSDSIQGLMIGRVVQAFGGSIGSVLSQAMCRDAFHGPALGRVYAATGSALALFPALGPVCGGLMAETFGWRNLFLFLTAFAGGLLACTRRCLPETHPRQGRTTVPLWGVAGALVQDKKVISFGLIVAGCSGILFSYFAEGSFCLIKHLGMTPSHYGFSFTMIAFCTFLGGVWAKKLHNTHTGLTIIRYGLSVIVSVTTVSAGMVLAHSIWGFSATTMKIATVTTQMGCAFGICMTASNALAMALVNYKHAIGTASSLFGFFYYAVISLITLGMGMLHNGTLVPMPLYFCALAWGMWALFIHVFQETT